MLKEMFRKFASLRLSLLLIVGASIAILNGCALLYFPLLLFVPLQPIIMILVKAGARYGPLFLMMLVQADPNLPGQDIIALSPPAITAETYLPTLEDEMFCQIENEHNVVEMKLVDIDLLDENWLNHQLLLAQKKGCKVQMVMVDSRGFEHGKSLSANLLKALKNSKIKFEARGDSAQAAVANINKSTSVSSEDKSLTLIEN